MKKSWTPKKKAKQTIAQKRLCRELGSRGKAKRDENTKANIMALKKSMRGMELK